ncbi:hypothetical protein CsSME_00046841 [Camellia sinensis var. sinensis]
MEGGKRAEEEAGPSCGGCCSDENQEMKPFESSSIHQKQLVDVCPAAAADDDDDYADNDDDVDDDDDDHRQDGGTIGEFVPSPLLPLKLQIDKDKDDESLRRWKEKLLGCVEEDLNEQMEPEVIFHSIGIISDDFGEISTPIPVDETKDGRVLFTLKEGSEYRLKLAFTVLHNIVSGLMYTNTVWKGGLRVDQSKGMLGTFAPQREPYVHTLDEDTAPSGVLARGTYTANLKGWRVFVSLTYLMKCFRERQPKLSVVKGGEMGCEVRVGGEETLCPVHLKEVKSLLIFLLRRVN